MIFKQIYLIPRWDPNRMAASDITVIDIVNEQWDLSSNPGRGCLPFNFMLVSTGKARIHLSSFSYKWLIEQTGLFNLGKATCLGEGKLWIQTIFTPLKNSNLRCILPIGEGLGKYITCLHGTGSNGNGGEHHTLHISWIGVSPSNAVKCHFFLKGILIHLCRLVSLAFMAYQPL